jgi:hypothetical protein
MSDYWQDGERFKRVSLSMCGRLLDDHDAVGSLFVLSPLKPIDKIEGEINGLESVN